MHRCYAIIALCVTVGLGCGDAAGPPDQILTQGTVTLPTFQGIDLETGTFTSSGSTADLYLHTILGHLELVAPGAFNDYDYFGTSAPTRDQCHGGLVQQYWLDTLQHDVYSCIVTGASHTGYFHFPVWPPYGLDSVRIAYVLWKN